MKIYERGDVVWCVGIGSTNKLITCPVCSGNKKVTLILGDERRVELPCEFCGAGYNAPTGTIMEASYHHEPKLRTINEVDVKTSDKGIDIRYTTTDHHLYDPEGVFDNEADAIDASIINAKKYEDEQFERYLRRKQYAENNRTYSWGAGYHMRAAKKDRESAERHEAMAKVCKERIK